jgi:hypothetical protein
MIEESNILETAKKRFNRVCSAEQEYRNKALEDLRFLGGQQWSENVRAERESQDRPLLTINKLRRYVTQLTNDQRMSRPEIRIHPAGEEATLQAARVYEEFVRRIQAESRADLAYDTAFEHAASLGVGFWRILTDYESETTFNQVIRIERIRNPFSVYIDPTTQAQDASDMRWCFITELIDRDEFEEDYPDVEIGNWEATGAGENLKQWYTDKRIRVAEYFEKVYETKTLYLLPNDLTTYERPDNPDLIVDERETDVPKIIWRKLIGTTILEEQDWLGSHIPIVRVVGTELDINGKVTFEGVVRHAKDPQRIYNYWVTMQTEQVALSPKAPYIMASGQAMGHEADWRDANRRPKGALFYEPLSLDGSPVPPPIKIPAPEVSTGILTSLQLADKDMMDTVGIYQANLGEQSNERSGVAITARQKQGDINLYHFQDNLSRSLKRTGLILLDLIPKVYDTKRNLRLTHEDGNNEPFMLDPGQIEPLTTKTINGQPVKHFNLKLGIYDVDVSVGPAFMTRRQEAAASMLEFMKVVPQQAQFLADLVARNMDWPGSDELVERLQKLLPPGIATVPGDSQTPQQRAAQFQLMQQAQQIKQQAEQLKQAQQQTEALARDRERELAQLEFKAFKEKSQAEMKLMQAAFKEKLNAIKSQLIKERQTAVKHTEKLAVSKVM